MKYPILLLVLWYLSNIGDYITTLFLIDKFTLLASPEWEINLFVSESFISEDIYIRWLMAILVKMLIVIIWPRFIWLVSGFRMPWQAPVPLKFRKKSARTALLIMSTITAAVVVWNYLAWSLG